MKTIAALILRVVIAGSMLISGVIHQDLYLHGYGHVPTIGAAFLVQASVFYAVGVLILLGGPAWLVWSGGVLATGVLAAFAMSRTVGIGGFVERGWEPAPLAALSVVAGVVTVVCVVIFVSVAGRTRRTTSRRETP